MRGSGSSTLFRNAAANYGGFFFQIGIAFFLSPFLVHTLGDTKYGIWSVVSALSGYMSLLDLGISSALTRYVSKYNQSGEGEKISEIVNSGFGLYTLLGLLLIITSPLTAKVFVHFIHFDPSLIEIVKQLVILTSFDVAFFLVAGAYRGVFQGLQQFGTINFILIATGAIKALLFLVLLSNGYGLVSMSIITILEKLITLSIFYFLLKKALSFRFEFKNMNLHGIKTILSFSFFTFLNMVANQIIYYSDAFVIGYFAGAAAVTYYSIAWSLMEYVKKFCLSFTRVFIPAFSEMEAANDFKKIRVYLINGSKYALLSCCLFCFGLIVYGENFIALWMGPEYGATCAPILTILLLSQFIELPQLISLAVLLGISKHKYMSYVSLATGVINVVLSVVLIQKFGLIGVAIGTTLPQILIYGVFMFYYTNKCVNLSLWKYFIGVYAPVIIPSFLIFITGIMMKNFVNPDSFFILFFQASISAIIFIFSLYVFSLKKDEKDAVLNKIKRLLGRYASIKVK